MTVRSAWLLTRPNGQTREDTRRAPLGTMTPIDEAQTLSGVIPGGDPYSLTPTGAMTATIGLGRAVIQGVLSQGAYGHVVTDPETITVPDGDSLLDRIDTVYAVIYDGLYDASGQTLAAIELVSGTPAASPSPPDPPTPTALPLYDIEVPAGTSTGSGGVDWQGGITDRRAYTVAVGGITPGNTGDGAYPGQWRDNAGQLQRWDGAAWSTRSPHAGATWEADLLLGSTRRIRVGSDVEWYRDGANRWRTPDSVTIDGDVSVGGVGQVMYAWKTGNQTRQTSTLSEDPDLQFTLAPNARYAMTGYLVYGNSDDGSDFNIDWTTPSGSSGWWSPFALDLSSASVSGGSMRTVASAVNAARSIGTTTAEPLGAALRGTVITGASGGLYAMQWARLSGTGIATLYAGSWLRLERMA